MMSDDDTRRVIGEIEAIEAATFEVRLAGVEVAVSWRDLPWAAQDEFLARSVDWQGVGVGEKGRLIDRAMGLDAAADEYDAMRALEDTSRDGASPPRVGARSPNHGTYQVWQGGEVHSLDVESVGLREVHELTGDAVSFWAADPAVSFVAEGQRPTRLGDVIVDPTCGAWEVQEGGYMEVAPPAAVRERMEREGIVPEHRRALEEWVEGYLSALDHDPPADREGGRRR